MTGMDGCRMNGSGWLFPGGGVATPHGASHEEDGSFPWEGLVPSVSHRTTSSERGDSSEH